MTCEEFAIAELDLGSPELDGPLQRAAREHLRECPHCAALHENWLTLRQDLRVLGAETAEAETPSRVEMRLRQEFRTRHKTVKRQRAAFVLGWSLAAAAAIAFSFTGMNWRAHRGANVADRQPSAVQAPLFAGNADAATQNGTSAGADSSEVLIASNNAGDFTLLPDSMPPAPEDATIVRVQMQRAALEALGLTVNEEHAGDWIQVDLLVGDDGLPQAVRLPQATQQTTN